MASLPESSTFDAGVYQLELTDPVIGGPSGVSNAPLKNLANRTKYLKDHVDALELTRAPIANPEFTGNPKAPTPAAGDNDTSIATTNFVQTAIAAAAASVASATVAGIVELATAAEVDAGTDTARAVTPAGLQAKKANDQKYGLVRLATTLEAQALTDDYVAITPYALDKAFRGGAQQLGTSGFQKLPGGLIIQWGRLTNVNYNQTAYTVTFPIAFPNGFLNGSVSLVQNGWNSDSPGAVILNNSQSPTNAQMQIGVEYYSVSGIVGDLMWFAIGY